jgi:hypothetical protein
MVKPRRISSWSWPLKHKPMVSLGITKKPWFVGNLRSGLLRCLHHILWYFTWYFAAQASFDALKNPWKVSSTVSRMLHLTPLHERISQALNLYESIKQNAPQWVPCHGRTTWFLISWLTPQKDLETKIRCITIYIYTYQKLIIDIDWMSEIDTFSSMLPDIDDVSNMLLNSSKFYLVGG